MTTKVAVYGVGGTLLVACLAAANMPQSSDAPPPHATRAARPAGPDALAREVTAQATLLHDRLAQAPVPAATPRNPFAFNTAHAAAPAAGMVRAATVDEPAAVFSAPMPVLPALTLMGVAEDSSPAGPKRTAVIGGDGDAIYMVREGDAVGDRYRVTKIGADAVELEDVVTKGYRRLALR